MYKVSHFMNSLRSVASGYDWFVDGGNIYAQSRRRRSERSARLEPIVVAMRVEQHNNRIRRYRPDWTYRYNSPNVPEIRRACQRPGRRGHSTRQKWIRKMVISCLNLGGQDD